MKVFICDMCQGGNVKFAIRIDGDEVRLSSFEPIGDGEVQHICSQVTCLLAILNKNNDKMIFEWPPMAAAHCGRLHTDQQGA